MAQKVNCFLTHNYTLGSCFLELPVYIHTCKDNSQTCTHINCLVRMKEEQLTSHGCFTYSYWWLIRWNISCVYYLFVFSFVNGLHIFFNPFMFEDLSFITKYDLFERGKFQKSQISENIMNPESKTNWSESLCGED